MPHKCDECGRGMSPFQNARQTGNNKIICMACYDKVRYTAQPIMNAGPYRVMDYEDPPVSSKDRVLLALEIGDVMRTVRGLFLKLTPEQRLAAWNEYMTGYCKRCGIVAGGRPCRCEAK